MSREECRQHAYEEATRLFQERIENSQPPVPVPVDGLYVLITETEEEWVPKHLVDDPDACMAFLLKQLKDGIIGQRIYSAFGQWYLYGNQVLFSSMRVLRYALSYHVLVMHYQYMSCLVLIISLYTNAYGLYIIMFLFWVILLWSSGEYTAELEKTWRAKRVL